MPARPTPGPRRHPRGEAGMSLVEMVVVLVILGILTAVAVPVYLNQRAGGYRSAVRSDLAVAATALEGWSLDRGRTFAPDGADTAAAALAQPARFTPSAGITVTVARAEATSYCLEGVHGSLDGEIWVLDSTVGTPTRTTTGC